MPHALRAHVRKAEPVLRQTEIEHRQLETVKRLEAVLGEAEQKAPSPSSEPLTAG